MKRLPTRFIPKTIMATASTDGRSGMLSIRRIAVIPVLVGISSCASLEDTKHLLANDWRLGRILEIANAAQIEGGATVDCRDRFSPVPIAGQLFARVGYRYEKRIRTMIVPITGSASLKPDDLAWVKVGDCSVSPEPYDRGRWLRG